MVHFRYLFSCQITASSFLGFSAIISSLFKVWHHYQGFGLGLYHTATCAFIVITRVNTFYVHVVYTNN